MYELKNYMENLVEQTFDTATNDLGVCKCKKCKLDIMAIALNSLKPRYSVTRRGAVYVKISMLEQQYTTDVLAAIIRASMIVKDCDHHEE